MYLARHRIKHKIHYILRESVTDGKTFRSRDLVNLGTDPGAFIVYPDNGNAFYFDERLLAKLAENGVEPDDSVLEKVLWPFLHPETRRLLESFTRHSPGRKDRLADEVNRCETEPFHLFDQRRIHFLRFGEIDQTRLPWTPKKLYRKLLDKSRDELEQQFFEMERVLRAHEKKNYAFAIFNVQSHFESPIARKFPQALPQDKVDACFLEEVCRLNADAGFWGDLPMSDRLHEYLVRYVVWFFDSDFEGSHYLEDLIWQFKRRHHGFQPPAPREHMPLHDALRMLSIHESELEGLTIKDLTRQYRRMAKQHHPDKGGSHETFIRLNRAFEDLLRRLTSGQGKTRYRSPA